MSRSLLRPILGPGYPFRIVRSEQPPLPGGFLLHTYVCPFRTKSGDHYLVQVEAYQHHLYVVKFYLKRDRTFPAESAYLLLNRRALAHQPDLLIQAAAMFDALYLMPDTLRTSGPPAPAGVG